MSLAPDEVPETNTLSLYEELKSATSNMHYWMKALQQAVETARKAEIDISTAEAYIAAHTQKMNEALTKLGFLNAPDAEVAA